MIKRSPDVLYKVQIKTDLMAMFMDYVIRIVSWLNRLTVCLRYLTLASTLQLFLLRNVPATPRKAILRNKRTPFFYRGFSDYGVMWHFYNEYYEIVVDSREVRWIIDLGANIGDETVKFALRHPNASILAIEPESKNFELLVTNIKPFSSRVFPLQYGVWYKDARLKIHPGASVVQPNECFFVEESPAGTIEGKCVPTLMRTFGIKEIDILKIDIEGSEFELFRYGFEDWLPAVRSIVIEIADAERPGSMQNFFYAFQKMGLNFDFYICGENLVGLARGSGLRFRKTVGI
jgi:FkbM family methyltransferase